MVVIIELVVVIVLIIVIVLFVLLAVVLVFVLVHFIATSGRTWEFSSAEILASNELASSTTSVVLFPEKNGRPTDRISWDREELTD